MARDIFYTAIDIGTSKICTIIAQVGPEGNLKVVGTGLAPSQGVEKASITTTAEAQEAIRASLAEAERYLGRRVPEAYVSISGREITCLNTTGLIHPASREEPVSRKDILNLIESSYPKADTEKEVVHVIPVNYWIDGYRSVRNPVGLHASQLQVESHVVMGERSHVYGTIRAVENCGVIVRSLVLGALASSEATLSEHEKEIGVLLVDIGDGSTDMAIFKHGELWYNASTPVGGKQFTRDLSVALGMPYYVAEELKEKWGHAMLTPEEAQEEVALPSFHGRPSRLLRRAELCKPLVDRLQETLGLIMVKAQQAGLSRFPAGGVVITGGTAEMPGLRQKARDILGCPVRIASPLEVQGLPPEQLKPSYSTVIGLLLWGIKHHGEKPLYRSGDRTPWDHKVLIQRFKELIEAK